MNLMGLLEDKDALMTLAASLLSARKGQEGQALGQGLLGAMQVKRQNANSLLDQEGKRLGMDAQRMQMDEMKRQMDVRQRMTQAAERNFTPGQPQMLPTDQETPSGPQGPAGFNFQGYANDLMRAGPEGIDKGIGLLSSLRKQAEPIKLKDNERLLDPTTRRELVGTAPGDQWETIGRDEKTGQQIQRNTKTGQLKAIGSMPHQVNVSTNMPPLEKREQGDMGALHIKNYGEIQGAANVARKENALLTGLEKINLDTGKLTPANVTVSGWVAALGGGQRFKDVAAQGEGFTGFAKDLVLQRQLAQKGPQTESDAKRLEQTVAQLGNTPAANKLLVTFQKAQNNRIIEQEKFYNDWWTKNKTMQGADAAWINGKGASSLWDEPSLKAFQGPSRVIDFSELPSANGR